MSAVPRSITVTDLAGLRMTAREFLAIGETPERYELVNGVVLMSPSGSFEHNDLLSELIYRLRHYAHEHPGAKVVCDTDVRFSNLNVYCPDIVAYRAGRFAQKPKRPTEPPDLVVEILSPGNRNMDLVTKLADYSRYSVLEYWVFEPSSAVVRCWRRTGRKLVESRVTGLSLRSLGLPGFVLDLTEVREAVGLPALGLRKR